MSSIVRGTPADYLDTQGVFCHFVASLHLAVKTGAIALTIRKPGRYIPLCAAGLDCENWESCEKRHGNEKAKSVIRRIGHSHDARIRPFSAYFEYHSSVVDPVRLLNQELAAMRARPGGLEAGLASNYSFTSIPFRHRYYMGKSVVLSLDGIMTSDLATAVSLFPKRIVFEPRCALGTLSEYHNIYDCINCVFNIQGNSGVFYLDGNDEASYKRLIRDTVDEYNKNKDNNFDKSSLIQINTCIITSGGGSWADRVKGSEV